MMKNVYTIRDLKAENCPALFLSLSDGTALRDVCEAVNGGTSILSQYPADFQLIRIGNYDDVLGVITPTDHVVICNLDTLVDRNKD